MIRVLGVDAGGAHIKTALALHGKTLRLTPRRTYPYEIFRDPGRLETILAAIARRERPGAIALTMTAELSDVFASRREGVRYILRAAAKTFAGIPWRVVDVSGELVPPARARRWPMRVASANWSATGRWLAPRVGAAIMVDIGSTTTDIIPLRGGRMAARGATDHERLRHGELLYMGYLRTHPASILPRVTLRGAEYPLCPEHFALMGDAYLALGVIHSRRYSAPTPDGRAKTPRAAASRLARLVMSDYGDLGKDQTRQLARALITKQVDLIAQAIRRVARRERLTRAPLIVIGPMAEWFGTALAPKVTNPLTDTVDGVPAAMVDPASCAAALMAEGEMFKGES
ncbi:MAG: hypothetical protein HY804_05840 [Nitrospinae bacterium]|nr:hypothetical protein [Nitrospinota bacterium]